MWTPRNEPLPPPDPPVFTRLHAFSNGNGDGVGLCFFHSSSTVTFPSALIPGVMPIPQYQIPSGTTAPSLATTTAEISAPPNASTLHHQAFLNTANTGYPILTPDETAALAMAAVAYFNNPPLSTALHGSALHQSTPPGPASQMPNQPSVTATIWNGNINGSFL